MCGIFAFIKKSSKYDYIKTYKNFEKLRPRGPDNTQNRQINNSLLCFHRLAINDLSKSGNQPMKLDNNYLICNGEIFNHKTLKQQYNFSTNSKSDCEIILHLYKYYKSLNYDNLKIMNLICNDLDGEFSFLLYDTDIDHFFISRDPYGVRPLFYGLTSNKDYIFSSELKGLNNIAESVEQFKPGHFMIINNTIDYYDLKYDCYNDMTKNDIKYHCYNDMSKYDVKYSMIDSEANNDLKELNRIFREAVYKRMMSDKEICALLSGGLDSSLVAGILAQKLGPYKLKTFSIGLKGSPDLFYAKKVADFIKSEHHTIELTEKEFLDSIDEVIRVIESYDTTTVRASVGNYLVSKYIKENTNCKVVFNGDYADEVCGGYKYFKKTKDLEEFHNECLRLIGDIHYFDCLRSDRTISANGLEARVPFADKYFIDYYLKMHPKFRCSYNKIEKCPIRKAFENDNVLPNEVLWRSKEAFSDGVTSETRSWHTIIQEYIDNKVSDIEFNNENKYTYNKPILKESYYYRKKFDENYKKFEKVIPYYWMPKWCGEMTDPSAREIKLE